MCVVFHRHVPFVRDVKHGFVVQKPCRIENTCEVSPGDEQTFHAIEDDQPVKTYCHKTDTDVVSPSDERRSHVWTYFGVLQTSCHRMNIGVFFHRHVPFARDVEQSICDQMTCRRENICGVSPSYEQFSRDQ